MAASGISVYFIFFLWICSGGIIPPEFGIWISVRIFGLVLCQIWIRAPLASGSYVFEHRVFH